MQARVWARPTGRKGAKKPAVAKTETKGHGRIRKDNGPANMAVLPRRALDVTRLDRAKDR
jgi:hypothetical protein